MTKEDKIDLVKNTLSKYKYEEITIYDYIELEKRDPKNFKGRGDKNGIMLLTSIAYDLYIDVYILDTDVKMVFRKDDSSLLKMNLVNYNSIEEMLCYFITMVDNYMSVYNDMKKFNKGEIPKSFLREYKMDILLKD